MDDLSKVSVVLPSLDPDEKLTAVIDGLLEYGFQDIILVNDGSREEKLHYFTDAAAAHPEITLLTHEVNRGKGAALKTAFSWFLANRPQGLGVVTVDGDNQHHPEDTRACAIHMLETGRVTLGCRDFSLPDVPPRSRFGNRTTSLVFKLFCGITLSDTQTGLRAIPRSAVEAFTQVYGDRFEYETNMLLAMKTDGIPFDEVTIRTVYIEEHKSSHFHWLRDSWRIYKLSGAVGGFALTAAAGVTARVISSLVNFFLNKNVVFRTQVDTRRAMVRYYALAIPQMGAQILLTQGLYTLFRISDRAGGIRTLWYVVVMVVLYFVSYTIQQRWVFAPQKSESAR